MTPCAQQAQRDAWLDGTLSPDQRAAFETHLATCAECSSMVETWNAFGRGLIESEAAMKSEVSPAQVTRLLARAKESRAKMPRWIPLSALAASMAAMVAWVVVSRKEAAPQVLETRVVAVVDGTASGQGAQTTEKGRAVLDIGADRIGVAHATRMEIERADKKATRIRLKKGTLAARVDHARGKRDFTVNTPLGEVHVVGTEFRVKAQEHLLQVEVLQGEVEVKLPSGPVRVPAGKQWSTEGNAPHLEALQAQNFAELEPEPTTTPNEDFAADAGVIETDAGVVEEEEPFDGGQPRTRVPAKAPIAAWRTRAAHGECTEVTKEAKRWAATHPKEAGAWLVIGDCLRRANRFKDAVEAYLKAGKQPGAESDTGMLLAASVMQDNLKQNTRALKLLESLVASKPSKAVEAAALVRQARAHQALGRAAKAKTILERVVAQFADTPSAAEAAGMLKLQ